MVRMRGVTTMGVGWASGKVSDLVEPPMNLVLYMHLRIFAYTSNTLIVSFEYMECMLVADTLKNFRFLMRSCLFTERAPVMKFTYSTFHPWRCIASLMVFRRDAYWSSAVRLALVRYRSQTSDILLCSRMQKTPVLLSTGGRTAIPSGCIRQNLTFTVTSFETPAWILPSSACVRGRSISRVLAAFHILSCSTVNQIQILYALDFGWNLISFHMVWRHFSPEMHKNFHSGAASRASSPCISRQHWWWASIWAADRASHVS